MLRKLFLSAFVMFISGAAFSQDDSDHWQFSVTPYLWLPSIGGALNYQLPPGTGGNPTFDIGPTDWLSLIDAAALVGGNARKGKFSITADFIYLSLANEPDGRLVSVEGETPGPGPINIPVAADITLATETDFDALAWNLAFGYAVYQEDTSFVDLLIGARYIGFDMSTDWNLSAAVTTPGGTELLAADGDINGDADGWDTIVGVRGQFGIAESHWSVPFYLDVGTGFSDRTWNAMAGVSRGFNWGDLMLVYRHMEYDQGSDGPVQEFSFSGPAIGARFSF